MSTKKLPFKTLGDLTVQAGQPVLVRTSLNVPIKDGVIENQFRITRGLATVQHLVQQGGKVVLLGHIGSKGGQSTEPIADLLSSLGYSVTFCKSVSGAEAKNCVDNAAAGSVILLENVRRDPREKQNDPEFARELSELAAVYINDAFAASHREHASLVGVPALLPAYAGFNFVHEYEALSQMRAPTSPSLFMLGGAKFDTKLPLVEQFLERYSRVFIGGALANDLFQARGYEVGNSLVSDISLANNPIVRHPNLLLPVDVIVTDGTRTRVCAPDAVQTNETIYDAGPETVTMLTPLVTQARSILWNGPLGNYEAGFNEQTEAAARLVAEAPGHAVVGGGDTVASIESLGVQEHFAFLSTAGGAMLHFLEHGTLPAITALSQTKE